MNMFLTILFLAVSSSSAKDDCCGELGRVKKDVLKIHEDLGVCQSNANTRETILTKKLKELEATAEDLTTKNHGLESALQNDVEKVILERDELLELTKNLQTDLAESQKSLQAAQLTHKEQMDLLMRENKNLDAKYNELDKVEAEWKRKVATLDETIATLQTEANEHTIHKQKLEKAIENEKQAKLSVTEKLREPELRKQRFQKRFQEHMDYVRETVSAATAVLHPYYAYVEPVVVPAKAYSKAAVDYAVASYPTVAETTDRSLKLVRSESFKNYEWAKNASIPYYKQARTASMPYEKEAWNAAAPHLNYAQNSINKAWEATTNERKVFWETYEAKVLPVVLQTRQVHKKVVATTAHGIFVAFDLFSDYLEVEHYKPTSFLYRLVNLIKNNSVVVVYMIEALVALFILRMLFGRSGRQTTIVKKKQQQQQQAKKNANKKKPANPGKKNGKHKGRK